MSRHLRGRGRILPGPLTPLPLEARPNGGLMIAAFAATAVAVAGAVFVLPRGVPQIPAPEPVATASVAEPAGEAPSPPRAEAAPAPSERVAAVSPVSEPEGSAKAPAKQASKPIAAKSEPAKPAVVKQAAAAPSIDDQLFRLDLLPVLKAGNGTAGLDAVPNAAPAKAARTASRKAVRSAGTAGEPAQP